MGRLVILLIVAAGLPGTLLGSIAAFLVFGTFPVEATVASLPDQSLLALLGLALILLLLATGVMARSWRPGRPATAARQ